MRYTILFVLLFLCSCRTIRYVPEVHTEYITRTDSFVSWDSVYIHDSVSSERMNDTIRITKWRTEFRDRWRDRIVTDSFVKRDSIPYPVEKELTWWQKKKIAYGETMMVLLFILLFYSVFRLCVGGRRS